jgi:hypothetical protein
LGGYDRPELTQNDDGIVTLLEARALHLKFNLLLVLNVVKLGVTQVKVARQENLHG